MTEVWMYGKDAAVEIAPVCDCCHRTVERVRGSMWHGRDRVCPECFIMWYDPDGDIDVTNRLAVGNAVRKKHGLPPLL